MTVRRHTFAGKSAGTFITSKGEVIHLNIENLTIAADDGEDDDMSFYYGYKYRLPAQITYSLEGNMAEIGDDGTVFEIRSPR